MKNKLTVYDLLKLKGVRQIHEVYVNNVEEAIAAEEAGIDMICTAYDMPHHGIFGKLDDIWQDKKTEKLFIADYKATSKKELKELHPVFKMQMDIYVFIAQKINDQFQDKTYFFYKNFC